MSLINHTECNVSETLKAALVVPRQRTFADLKAANAMEKRLRSTIEMMKKHDNVEWWLRTWLRD